MTAVPRMGGKEVPDFGSIGRSELESSPASRRYASDWKRRFTNRPQCARAVRVDA